MTQSSVIGPKEVIKTVELDFALRRDKHALVNMRFMNAKGKEISALSLFTHGRVAKTETLDLSAGERIAGFRVSKSDGFIRSIQLKIK